MPARVTQALLARNPEEVKALAVAMAGFIDSPIAAVRIDFGDATDLGGGSFSRNVTFTVCDRLGNPYPPKLFERTVDPALKARWQFHWYTATTQFGDPVDYGPSYTTGRKIGQIGNQQVAQTDESGVCVVSITKATGDTWFHAGMACLLRSKGVNFAQLPDAPGVPGGGPGSGGPGGGSSSGGGVLSDPPTTNTSTS